MHVQSCCFAYNTYCFLTFSSPSASLDLKVPIGCWNQRKLKAPILRVVVFVNDPPSADSFLLFYGLKVGKYASICAMEIQKIHMVVHIFSGFALFTESECIAELNPSASCWPLTRCLLIYQQTSANQNTVHLKSGFIWKFSREWLLWTGYASGGSLLIAHCDRNLNRQLWSIRRKTSHRSSRNFCKHYYESWWR